MSDKDSTPASERELEPHLASLPPRRRRRRGRHGESAGQAAKKRGTPIQQEVYAALARSLTARQLECVVHLYGLNGFAPLHQAEIASLLDISPQAVGNTLRRAHARIGVDEDLRACMDLLPKKDAEDPDPFGNAIQRADNIDYSASGSRDRGQTRRPETIDGPEWSEGAAAGVAHRAAEGADPESEGLDAVQAYIAPHEFEQVPTPLGKPNTRRGPQRPGIFGVRYGPDTGVAWEMGEGPHNPTDGPLGTVTLREPDEVLEIDGTAWSSDVGRPEFDARTSKYIKRASKEGEARVDGWLAYYLFTDVGRRRANPHRQQGRAQMPAAAACRLCHDAVSGRCSMHGKASMYEAWEIGWEEAKWHVRRLYQLAQQCKCEEWNGIHDQGCGFVPSDERERHWQDADLARADLRRRRRAWKGWGPGEVRGSPYPWRNTDQEPGNSASMEDQE
jgi:DNA-binding CsgD family transcriptional regulator